MHARGEVEGGAEGGDDGHVGEYGLCDGCFGVGEEVVVGGDFEATVGGDGRGGEGEGSGGGGAGGECAEGVEGGGGVLCCAVGGKPGDYWRWLS